LLKSILIKNQFCTLKNIMRGPKTPFVITFLMTLSFEQSRDLDADFTPLLRLAPSRTSVVGRDLGHGTADGLGSAGSTMRRRDERRPSRARIISADSRGGAAAQLDYIEASGHGFQCEAGCRSRWGCRVVTSLRIASVGPCAR